MEFEFGRRELRVNKNIRAGAAKKPVEIEYGGVKVKVSDDKKINLYGEEMTSERSVGYLARMHGRCTENFGEQSADDRIS